MQEGEACPMTAPADLPPSRSADPWTLVLEELPGAPRMMQGALYGLILERRLNSYTLPINTRVVATGNMATSGGVIQAMPKPLANRMQHCRLICTPDEHLAHAQASGWHAFVTAYHHFTQGKEWSNFDAKSPEETYASPRSWEMASDALTAGNLPADLITPVFSGLLGYGIGQKFAAFCRLYADLAPTITSMRNAPDSCALPDDAACQWFLAATIAGSAAEAQSNPAGFACWSIPFITRLPDELCVFAMNSITRATPTLASTPEFIKHFATNPRYAALAQFCK
jgi:hypothetical protein